MAAWSDGSSAGAASVSPNRNLRKLASWPGFAWLSTASNSLASVVAAVAASEPDVDFTADDGIGTFNLVAGASQTLSHTVLGPFSGQATVDNTVTASWVLPVLVASSLLNAAYFLPIVFMIWFAREEIGGKEHGEAPFAAVMALVVSAALTLAFFGFSARPYELEAQLVRGQP